MSIDMQIESTRNYRAGYRVHRGVWKVPGCPDTPMRWATNPVGDYIGDPKDAYHLCRVRGIAPEVRDGTTVCSIGFCEREQKWYGWSHRAIYGFGIGDVVKEGDCTATSGWIDEHLVAHPEDDLSLPVGFEAKTLEDAKRMAIAFAENVS